MHALRNGKSNSSISSFLPEKFLFSSEFSEMKKRYLKLETRKWSIVYSFWSATSVILKEGTGS